MLKKNKNLECQPLMKSIRKGNSSALLLNSATLFRKSYKSIENKTNK